MDYPPPNPNYHQEAYYDYHSERRKALDGLYSEPGDHIDKAPWTCPVCERETIREERWHVDIGDAEVEACLACYCLLEDVAEACEANDPRDVELTIDISASASASDESEAENAAEDGDCR